MFKVTTKSVVIKAYNEGMPIAAIIHQYGVGASTVYKWVADERALGRIPTLRNTKRKTHDDVLKRSVIDEYCNGDCISIAALALKHKIKYQTLYSWINEATKAPQQKSAEISKQTKLNAINKITNGASFHKVSIDFGVSVDVIKLWVDEYRNGKLDAITTPNALKVIEPKTDLDTFCNVMKALIDGGVAATTAIDLAKGIVKIL